jgi:hypothetical protein
MTTVKDLKLNVTPTTPAPGDLIEFKVSPAASNFSYSWVNMASGGSTLTNEQWSPQKSGTDSWALQTDAKSTGMRTARVTVKDNSTGEEVILEKTISLRSVGTGANSISDSIAKIASEGLTVKASKTDPTDDQALWVKIRSCAGNRQFAAYDDFIKTNLCDAKPAYKSLDVSKTETCRYKHGVDGYQMLKAATEVFLVCKACCANGTISNFDPDSEESRLGYTTTQADIEAMLKSYLTPNTRRLPYLDTIITNLGLSGASSTNFPFCEASIRDSLCLYELIWSYWLEAGMLVQTMNAISMRFQNLRVPSNGRDALAGFEITPLRPLSNLLWGYVQDGVDGRRLAVARRAYEYAHEYGLQLSGKAVGELRPAESRSRFLEAFHNLLYLCADFYRENTNQWITPDPYPLLDALRSVHVLLAEGAHNQFGDLTTTARAEMMVEQWLLSQAPMSDFLQSRAMVPYDEPWMGPVDAMRKLMGWPDISIMYFHRLAVYGEQVLLSIRWGNWSALGTNSTQAANWALYWKPEIQGYIEAYRAVTGVELAPSFRAAVPVDTTQPAVHLSNRMDADRSVVASNVASNGASNGVSNGEALRNKGIAYRR